MNGDNLVQLARIKNPGLSSLLVTAADADIEAKPERRLVDVQSMSPSDVLARWRTRQASWTATPVDPSGQHLRLYPGGVTIWSGYPGEGKTTTLRQMAVMMACNGYPTFFASLEEHPEDLLLRLAMVAGGNPALDDEDEFSRFLDWSLGRLYVWGVIGTASHSEVLAVIRSLARRGLKHAVIDSLMCLDVRNDDFEGQRQFANLVAATARSTGVHIHVVAHPRKVVSRDQDPDINDVAGAREVAGIADNIVFMKRGNEEHGTDMAKPAVAHVLKNRHGGWCGKIHAFYRKDYGQVHDSAIHNHAINYTDGRPR